MHIKQMVSKIIHIEVTWFAESSQNMFCARYRCNLVRTYVFSRDDR